MTDIKQVAVKMLVELDRVRYTGKHERLLFPFVMELAKLCGTEIEYPISYVHSGVKISGRMEFGENFVSLFAKKEFGDSPYNPEYHTFYKREITADDCYCFMEYWDVEEIVKNAAHL